jgi:hypothetical protein
MLFQLKCDDVVERIVRKIDKRVDHMRIDAEQNHIVCAENGRVELIPDIL